MIKIETNDSNIIENIEGLDMIKLTPKDYTGYSKVNRDYSIIEFKFSDFTPEERDQIYVEAKNLYEKANPNGANTGTQRGDIAKWNDSIAGTIAEYATLVFFRKAFKEDTSHRPPVTSSENQIDIAWEHGGKEYSIEVRSSFVNNGINFALYASKKKSDTTEFDVLGPYCQKSYKSDYEPVKNIFMRVFFPTPKFNVEKKYVEENHSFYLIGGMLGKDLIELNYHKPLIAKNTVGLSRDGDYFVAPIDKIMDIKQFLEKFKETK